MKTQDRTMKDILDDFDLFFRIEDDGSIHLKDYKNGKYAIYEWIVDSLYKVSELKQPEKQEIDVVKEIISEVVRLNKEWGAVPNDFRHWYRELQEAVNKLLKK